MLKSKFQIPTHTVFCCQKLNYSKFQYLTIYIILKYDQELKYHTSYSGASGVSHVPDQISIFNNIYNSKI